MTRSFFSLLLLTLVSSFSFPAAAEEEKATPVLQYYALSPHITTNVYTQGKTIVYLRVSVDLMVADSSYIADLELHEPLIRDAIIEHIGKQQEEKVKSLAGKAALETELLDLLNGLLLAETGRTIIAKVLFSEYLAQ
ncbi:flagellar basal body-associated FliL family protein [Vibrio hannami]|uniref:flagellar basal body-associated FliL family protein n=1 Tax=Vibrio hannami TaxID=2717094 RepID=UPI002410309F|nr:flagellar basal body-associated FliL family protein [Vibrio hannami]MDG3086659.1 flagellar basal body-associated FliL family protein [Vibrio hannami]